MNNLDKSFLHEMIGKIFENGFDNKYYKYYNSRNVVLCCPDLIKTIFEHLTIPNDKLNFKLTCKFFYQSVKDKFYSKEESVLTDKFHTSFIMYYNGVPNWSAINVDAINNKIKNNLGNINKLVIEFGPTFHMTRSLEKFSFFKRIKILEFCGDINQHHFTIFKLSKYLQPQTITIDNFVNSWIIDKISPNEEWFFPKSMKNLTFKCDNKNCLKLLQKGLVNFYPNEIDTLNLFVSCIFSTNVTSSNDLFEATKYFKNVNIIYSGIYENTSFVKLFNSTIINSKYSKYNFFLRLSIYIDIWYQEISIICNKLLFLSLETKEYTAAGRKLLEENEVNRIYYCLSMMKSLETLIVDFSIINSGISFEKFCLVITKKLKNLQLVKCQQLNLVNLKNIANNLKNIEILSLHEVESEDITMIEIFELFPRVNCLEVFFSKSFESSKVSDVLANENRTRLKWPKTIILNIFTLFNDHNELEELRNMIRNTPLKSGQTNLAIQSYRKPSENDLLKLTRITFQKCSGCSEYFKVFKIKHFPHQYRIFMYEET
ncbi:Hypothetical protein SRAE_1000293300 [Strongyloides ratti]|uniref:F-box domain-containing protein n=1 Tax=Strongyloides ratti TaxID=34506 RepID=A0A090LB14_STRRB|nr:Hypothetical protein SRAE_1000293300 [Strongyloides ratti]CEF64680.1 Hypothetical protein SRAE_1000293300 [Strongyloides ratti]